DPTFTKITTGTILDELKGPEFAYWGSAWPDFNNDGLVDLFVGVGTAGNASFLFENAGQGSFTEVPFNFSSGTWGGVSGDFDNDGKLDVFLANGHGPLNGTTTLRKNLLYRNAGDGIFSQVTDGSIVNDLADSFSAAWADYNNDGFLDLFVANSTGRNFLYRNNGDGTFTKVLDPSITGDAANSHSVTWGDYDNDGYLDLFVTNGATDAVPGLPRKNSLYHNKGDGISRCVTTESPANDLAGSLCH